MSEWFEEWFNTKFYHILYKNRDEQEARNLLDRLIVNVPINSEDKVLDLACGMGRHSHYLSDKGYQVVGVDLSPRNIQIAKETENSNARFYIHDMRETVPEDGFDVVLNLFTSFGYFDSKEDNLRTLLAINKAMKPGGRLVIDFLNTLKCHEWENQKFDISEEGIDFHIDKQIRDGKIHKDIRFEHEGKDYAFHEEVQLLTIKDFTDLFEISGFEHDETLGNYQMEEWGPETERMIMLCTKK